MLCAIFLLFTFTDVRFSNSSTRTTNYVEFYIFPYKNVFFFNINANKFVAGKNKLEIIMIGYGHINNHAIMFHMFTVMYQGYGCHCYFTR